MATPKKGAANEGQQSGTGKKRGGGVKKPRVYKIMDMVGLLAKAQKAPNYVLIRSHTQERAADSVFSVAVATEDDLVQAGADGVAIIDLTKPAQTVSDAAAATT